MAADRVIRLTADDDIYSINAHIQTIKINRYIAPAVLDFEGTHKTLVRAMYIVSCADDADTAHTALMKLTNMLTADLPLPTRLNIRFDNDKVAIHAVHLL